VDSDEVMAKRTIQWDESPEELVKLVKWADGVLKTSQKAVK